MSVESTGAPIALPSEAAGPIAPQSLPLEASVPEKPRRLVNYNSCTFSRLSSFTAAALAPLLNNDGRRRVAAELSKALVDACSEMGDEEKLAQKPCSDSEWHVRNHKLAVASIEANRAEVWPLIRAGQDALNGLFAKALKVGEEE